MARRAGGAAGVGGEPGLDGEPLPAETEEERAGVVLDELVDELLTALLQVREPKELIGAILARKRGEGPGAAGRRHAGAHPGGRWAMNAALVQESAVQRLLALAAAVQGAVEAANGRVTAPLEAGGDGRRAGGGGAGPAAA